MKLSTLKPCRPDESDNLQLREYTTRVVEEKVPVYNEKGKLLRYNTRKKVVRDFVPDEVLENRGISCDIFTLSNQIAAGVSLTDIKGDFAAPSLEERQNLSDALDASFASIVDNSDNYVKIDK